MDTSLASSSRNMPLRIYGADDIFFQPNGNIHTIEQDLVRQNRGEKVPELETVRFSPLVLRREDIRSPNATKIVL